MTADKFAIPAKAKPHTDAMRALIRTGVGAAVGLEESPLLDLPVVTRKAGWGANAAQRATTFVDVLKNTIDQKLMGKDQTTALILFAYDEYAGMPMSDRYSLVAKLHKEHWKWEDYRKTQLDKHLYAVYLTLYLEGEANASAATGGAVVVDEERQRRQPVVGGDFALNSYEVIYNFPREPGELREMIETREVRATADNVPSWQMGSRYWGKNPDKSPTVALFGPGRLEIVEDRALHETPSSGRFYITKVTFPTPLMLNETTRFILVKRQSVDFGKIVREGWRDQRDVTPLNPIDQAKIAIRFPTDYTPMAVWHYEDMPDDLAPGVATEANTLTPDPNGYVQYVWNYPLFVGHTYGIAWEW